MSDFIDAIGEAAKTLTPKPVAEEAPRWKDGTRRDALPLDAGGHELDLERGATDFSYYSANRAAILAARRGEKQRELEGQLSADQEARNETARARKARHAERAAADATAKATADKAREDAAHAAKWGVE